MSREVEAEATEVLSGKDGVKLERLILSVLSKYKTRSSRAWEKMLKYDPASALKTLSIVSDTGSFESTYMRSLVPGVETRSAHTGEIVGVTKRVYERIKNIKKEEEMEVFLITQKVFG